MSKSCTLDVKWTFFLFADKFRLLWLLILVKYGWSGDPTYLTRILNWAVEGQTSLFVFEIFEVSADVPGKAWALLTALPFIFMKPLKNLKQCLSPNARKKILPVLQQSRRTSTARLIWRHARRLTSSNQPTNKSTSLCCHSVAVCSGASSFSRKREVNN